MEWSRVTHDKERLRLWEGLRGSVGCVLQRGPSFAWLAQAIGASKRARRRYPDVTVRVVAWWFPDDEFGSAHRCDAIRHVRACLERGNLR